MDSITCSRNTRYLRTFNGGMEWVEPHVYMYVHCPYTLNYLHVHVHYNYCYLLSLDPHLYVLCTYTWSLIITSIYRVWICNPLQQLVTWPSHDSMHWVTILDDWWAAHKLTIIIKFAFFVYSAHASLNCSSYIHVHKLSIQILRVFHCLCIRNWFVRFYKLLDSFIY